MDPKKGRRVRKIKVPTDSVPEFELGYTVTDLQRNHRRGRQERGRRHSNSNRGRRREEARVEETHSQEEGVAEKRPSTEKSHTETKTFGGEVNHHS